MQNFRRYLLSAFMASCVVSSVDCDYDFGVVQYDVGQPDSARGYAELDQSTGSFFVNITNDDGGCYWNNGEVLSSKSISLRDCDEDASWLNRGVRSYDISSPSSRERRMYNHKRPSILSSKRRMNHDYLDDVESSYVESVDGERCDIDSVSVHSSCDIEKVLCNSQENDVFMFGCNVGQGNFFMEVKTVYVDGARKYYVSIFDCGRQGAVNKTKALPELASTILNMDDVYVKNVFISHLDSDHVNLLPVVSCTKAFQRGVLDGDGVNMSVGGTREEFEARFKFRESIEVVEKSMLEKQRNKFVCIWPENNMLCNRPSRWWLRDQNADGAVGNGKCAYLGIADAVHGKVNIEFSGCSSSNANSLIVISKDSGVLYAGDSTEESLHRLNDGLLNDVRGMVVPHHGSRTHGSSLVLDKVWDRCKFVIGSLGGVSYMEGIGAAKSELCTHDVTATVKKRHRGGEKIRGGIYGFPVHSVGTVKTYNGERVERVACSVGRAMFSTTASVDSLGVCLLKRGEQYSALCFKAPYQLIDVAR